MVNLHRYLSQYQAPNGGFPYNVSEGQRQEVLIDTPMAYERADWGQPGGWARYNAWRWPDSKFHGLMWSWSPEFGALRANENNGGEVYEVVDNSWVRILFTTDYGSRKYNSAGDGNQYFNVCDVEGWGLFRTDVPSGRWHETLYGQRGGLNPTDCSGPINYGFTRTRKENITVPVMFNGKRYDRRMNVIFSEQYNNRSIAESDRVERFGYAEWLGRIFWQLCVRGGASQDISYRLPEFAFSQCPDGFGPYPADVRLATQFIFIPPEQRRTPYSYGWPFQ